MCQGTHIKFQVDPLKSDVVKSVKSEGREKSFSFSLFLEGRRPPSQWLNVFANKFHPNRSETSERSLSYPCTLNFIHIIETLRPYAAKTHLSSNSQGGGMMASPDLEFFNGVWRAASLLGDMQVNKILICRNLEPLYWWKRFMHTQTLPHKKITRGILG